MLQEALDARALPPILTMNDGRAVTPALWPERRWELLDILQNCLYGRTPSAVRASGRVVSEQAQAYAGMASGVRRIEVRFDTPGGPFAFPLFLFLPEGRPAATFLHIAFRHEPPDSYTPVEEILEGGFALALVYYHDLVDFLPYGSFDAGVAARFIRRPRGPDTWGKIGMWAYCASRALDVLETLPELDAGRVAVVGHSRFGKTALWCAAQDERFWAAVACHSGFGGAAVAKGATGERVADFLRAGSWDWFCETFKTFEGREEALPYDQHFLLACIAPRLVYLCNAAQDYDRDPGSEFFCALAASPAWRLQGKPGLVTPDRLPACGDALHEGDIGYHLRAGLHALSYRDWRQCMAFLRAKADLPSV